MIVAVVIVFKRREGILNSEQSIRQSGVTTARLF